MRTRADYGALRGAVTIVSTVIYVTSALAAVPAAWILVRFLRAERFDDALAPALVVVGLVLLDVVWFIAAGTINVIADNVEETVELHRTTRAAADRQAQMTADLLQRLDELLHWTAMSETARSLLVGKREVEVFNQHFEQVIGAGDWAEAERLIALLAELMADKVQVDMFRQRLKVAREMADDRIVRTRIGEVREMIDKGNFLAAEMGLQRLAADFPDDGRLEDLRATFTKARRRYGEQAQERFRKALAAERLDEASAIIDELAWNDADVIKEMREAWKGAFRHAQQQAREKFVAAVHEKRWADAVADGEQILKRFAETPLAAEVRKLIDMVRQRAGESAERRPPADAPADQDAAAGE